jgi:gluconokinase
MAISGLRSPHEKVGTLVYFGRMLDKIRLHAAGQLPADYTGNLGEGFDKACVQLLGVDYAAVVERVKQGGSDEEILAWCREKGRPLIDQDQYVWNEFMRKRGWNDSASQRLAERKAESGFSARDDIQTFFDYIDADEGKPLASR